MQEFTPQELLPYSGLVAFVVITLLVNYRKGPINCWSPVSVVSVIFFYYGVLGPFWAITTGNTFDRSVDLRDCYTEAFWGALVLLLAFGAGFRIFGPQYQPTDPVRSTEGDLFRSGWTLAIIGLTLFTISTGGNITNLINPLEAEGVEQFGGTLGNYLGLSLNFLIPALSLLWLYYFSTRNGLVPLLLLSLVALGVFISLGFRYRLILVFGGIGIGYFLFTQKKPNPILSLMTLAILIALMGVINVTRQYGRGLNTSLLGKERDDTIYESGLRESLVFQTSGALIKIVPEKHPHAGFAPIVSTLFFPIPSAVLAEKNSADYVYDALSAIYGEDYSFGAAFMSFGEYYLAFGWFGVIGAGVILGSLSRRLWNWYLAAYDDPMHISVYATTITFLYVVLSRGYLPQVTMLFFFSVAPIFVVYRIARKNVIAKRV